MKKLIGGMHKDSERVDQPEGTYRDALNANLYYTKGAIVNEEGTSIIGTHPIQIIGAIPLLNNQVISFGWVDDSGATVPSFDSTKSAIVLTDTKTKNSRILYKNAALNFQKNNPIVGEFRIDSKNEIIIYFTDNYYITETTPEGEVLSEYNSPRAFNVTRQLEHLTASAAELPYNHLYNADESFDVHKLDLFAKVGKHSLIEKVSIYEGGVLVSGSYHLALCYSDENFLETDYFVVSNPVYIFQGQEQQYPADVITGCQGGSQTNKAIKFKVKVFTNNNYKFLQPAIIKRVDGAEFAYKLERIELGNNQENEQIDISFTGNEDSSSTSVDDIILDNVNYLTAKTITQLDDRLYLANLQSQKDIGFQRYAHNIVLESVVKTINKFDVRIFDIQSLNTGYAIMVLPYWNRTAVQGAQFGIGQTFIRNYQSIGDTGGVGVTNEDYVRRNYFEYIQSLLDYASEGYQSVIGGEGDNSSDTQYLLSNKIAKGYKDYRFSFKHKSYRRGEVYAFYISFVLKDGTETYAYHIPGRVPLTANNLSEQNNFGSTEQGWSNIKETFHFWPSEIAEHNSAARIFQYIDTSNINFPDGQSSNNMSFWHNLNETYPSTFDFSGGIVTASGAGTNNPEYDLRNQPVRHHKMPSNHNTDRSFLALSKGNKWYSSHQSLLSDSTLNNSDLLNDSITGFDVEYRDKKLLTRDPIRLLGIQLKNIKIPKHILKKVQGYKIYYAKRKDADKIVVGQSIAVPSQPRYASSPTQNRLLARRGPYKNAFHLYGGLQHDDSNAMEINSTWKKSTFGGNDEYAHGRYIGHPVFTFHDFNMLRKRPTLEGLTHMSCQAAVVFRSFQGGPNIYRPPAKFEELMGDNGDGGDGESEFGLTGASRLTRFRSLGWIHPDLGNTTDFGLNNEVRDITDNYIDLNEDIENPWGNNASDGSDDTNSQKADRKRKRGKQLDDVGTKSEDLKIKNWRTSVYVAAKYIEPGEIFHADVVKGGDHRGQTNFFWNNYNAKNNQFVFRIDPKSRIYGPGLSNIEVPESTSFKGASVLYNRGGESSIVLGLESGLPHLRGLLKTTDSWWVGPVQGTSHNLVKWGDEIEYLFPDAFYYREKLPDHHLETYIDAGGGNYQEGQNDDEGLERARKTWRGYRFNLSGNKTWSGHPMAWLVNVESAKTDVYNPLDKQELVWTGFYKAINLKEEGGLESGVAEDSYGNNDNYYSGADSGQIYGGDTYITRYSFRSTSHSYGHSFFRAAINLGDAGYGNTIEDVSEAFHVLDGNKDRFQADIPSFQDPYDTQSWGTTLDMTIWNDFYLTDSRDKEKAVRTLLNNKSNWVQGNSDPVATLFSFMVESDDNIGLRHKNDIEKGISTKYFDADVASDVLFAPPTEDLTKQDNLLYADHYSDLQDIRVAVPYPKRKSADTDITKFTTRVIRSNVAGISIGDKYRQFLANEFKDIPKNRGDIWSLFTLGGLLYIHAERSLFKTQGKEELNVGGIAAFIGSGNIFTQPPTEIRDTETGYGGTTSIKGGITTPYGRFFISRRDKKLYLMSDGLQEIMTGMEGWFRENIPFQIEKFGVDVDGDNFAYNPDSTVSAAPMGFAVTYDPQYKRILITKREPVPNAAFIKQWALGNLVVRNNTLTLEGGCTEFETDDDFEEARKGLTKATVTQNVDALYCGPVGLANPQFFTPGGWTLSYYPELKIWGSQHSYLPKLYVSTAEKMFSYKDSYMWSHDNINAPGRFYNTTYPFEIEFIDNTEPAVSKSFSSIGYWLDIVKKDTSHITEYENKTYPGFTSFYVYNTTQISALSTNINYLQNARKVDKFWYINSFRDLAKYTTQTSAYINSGVANVVGEFTTTINATISSESMFTQEGVVNSAYLDSTKPWHMQKRFTDHYLGVRFSSDNSSTDLLYLYAAGTKFSKSNR